MRNPLGVAAGIGDGTITQYSVPGLVVKRINLQSGYTGLPHDALALNIGGAVVLKHKKIELGAIGAGRSQPRRLRRRSSSPSIAAPARG